MGIELEKECPSNLHDWTPIIEDNRTVGLQCVNCPKTVRENMEWSSIKVAESGAIIVGGLFHNVHLGSKRKGHRF